jgi:acyl carrier protein
MVPSAWVELDRLPLSAHGKVDRTALHAVATAAGRSVTTSDDPAASPMEQALAQIWMEVLNVDRVRARDNFFDLGGHSLVAMRVIARVRRTFEVELSVRDLFDAPTVVELSTLVAVRQAVRAAP